MPRGAAGEWARHMSFVSAIGAAGEGKRKRESEAEEKGEDRKQFRHAATNSVVGGVFRAGVRILTRCASARPSRTKKEDNAPEETPQ